MKDKLKIGIFFLVAFVIFFITLISIRQSTFLKSSYILKVKFYFIEGLRPASPVRFCGADVGEVKKVEVKKEDEKFVVYVYANINRDIKIPKNSSFIINSLSLFGEKYLEIIPPREIKDYFKDEDIAVGISPIPLFTVMSNFHKTMSEIDEFVKEGKIRTSFENIIFNLEETTKIIKENMQNFNKREGSLPKFLYDDSLYKSLKELIDEIKKNPWKLFYKPKEK